MTALQEFNRRLCEKAGDIFEHLLVPISEVQPVKTEAGDAKTGRMKAKVGQADKVNANRRIYSRELWGAVIERCKQKTAEGKLTGAVDHPGWSSGALKDTCILWHRLWMDEEGAVFGEFSIVSKANHGEHLNALIDAGVAIGFSTRGRGSANYPSDAQKARYGLGDNDCDVVIIADDYDLKKIDSVDDPSVEDAYHDNTPPASKRGGNETSHTEAIAMKTLAELQQQNAPLFALHTEAIATAIKPVQEKLTATETKLTATEAANKALKEAVDGFMATLAEKHGIQLMKELPEAQAAIKIEQLKLDVQKAEAAKTEVAGKLTQLEAANKALETKLQEQEKAQADSKRRADVAAKLPSLFGENKKWQKQITEQVLGDGKEAKGLIDGATFDVPALEAFVATKRKEYDAIAGGVGGRANEHYGITGAGAADTVAGGAGGEGNSVKNELRL